MMAWATDMSCSLYQRHAVRCIQLVLTVSWHAAMLAKRRSWLYLGGTLASALSIMMVMRLGTWFFGGRALMFQVCGCLMFSAPFISPLSAVSSNMSLCKALVCPVVHPSFCDLCVTQEVSPFWMHMAVLGAAAQ